MRMIGQFVPTAWAMEGLHQVITWGHGFAGTLLPIGVLAAMSLIFWLVGARTMRVTV
jgi:ABC-type multidrug transport system permease subunit